jgi:3-oxoacyl-[acyl-carrier-protein] synthase-1
LSVDDDGDHLAGSITDMLAKQNLDSEDMAMVVAHGNGNKKSDESEAQAITAVFGEYKVPVTAFKWSTGHTIAASGLLDTVLATKALNAHTVPGIANLERPAVQCEKLNIARDHREMDPNRSSAMIINRGFASINASLVIKRCE